MGFVKNFFALLGNSIRGTALIPCYDVDGVERTISSGGVFSVAAPVANDTYGVVVGSGTGQNSGAEFALGSQIGNGDAVGEVYYGKTRVVETAVQDGIVSMAVERPFFNLTSNDIVINEVGIVASVGGYNVLIARDVLDGIVVPGETGVTVVLSPQVTI